MKECVTHHVCDCIDAHRIDLGHRVHELEKEKESWGNEFSAVTMAKQKLAELELAIKIRDSNSKNVYRDYRALEEINRNLHAELASERKHRKIAEDGLIFLSNKLKEEKK